MQARTWIKASCVTRNTQNLTNPLPTRMYVFSFSIDPFTWEFNSITNILQIRKERRVKMTKKKTLWILMMTWTWCLQTSIKQQYLMENMKMLPQEQCKNTWRILVLEMDWNPIQFCNQHCHHVNNLTEQRTWISPFTKCSFTNTFISRGYSDRTRFWNVL